LSILIFLLLFVPLSIGVVFYIAPRTDRRYILKYVLRTWVFLGLFVFAIDKWMPFAGGGDDETYFLIANPPVNSVSDALDMTRFDGIMEQPGYPWVLSVLNAFTGHDLLTFKFLNLFSFIILAVVWYRIGYILEGREFARKMVIVILLITPLWYYVFILLKDMSVTLIQSLLLLATVQIWEKASLRPVITAIISALLLLFFRTALVLQTAAVLIGSLMAKLLGKGVKSRKLVPLFLGFILIVMILSVATNSEIMALLGVISESRVIGAATFWELGNQHGIRSEMNRTLFPILYLFTETAGLSPEAWKNWNAMWLRGVLALPWIIGFVPFFLFGVRWLFTRPTASGVKWVRIFNLRSARVMVTPWSAVLLFVMSSVFLSWTIGDSTRWRVPDMPMFAAIATAGWMYTRPKMRRLVLVLWVVALTVLFGAFYLLSNL
jgi:hypothetical protein